MTCFSKFFSEYLLYLQYNANYTIHICHFSFDYYRDYTLFLL